MLFLLNDTVLEVGSAMNTPSEIANQVGAASLDQLLGLVGQAFARDPCFARNSPAQARKAALMLLLKAPTQNGALFISGPAGLSARLASIDLILLFELKGLQDEGRLTSAEVNGRVWNAAFSQA